MIDLDALASIPARVRMTLDCANDQVCLVKIDTVEGQYCVVLDPDWVKFATEVGHQPGDPLAGISLPRAAVRAVIDGWEPEQALTDPRVQWAEDGVPHIGFCRPNVSSVD